LLPTADVIILRLKWTKFDFGKGMEGEGEIGWEWRKGKGGRGEDGRDNCCCPKHTQVTQLSSPISYVQSMWVVWR